MMKRPPAMKLLAALATAFLLLAGLTACSGEGDLEIGLEPLGFGHYNSVTFSLSSASSLSAAALTAAKKDSGYPGFRGLRAEGVVVGLGSDTYVARMTTTGDAVVVCRSPGGNVAPGRNFVFVGADEYLLEPDDRSTKRNGRDEFINEIESPDVLGDLDPATYCANGNWSAEIGYIDYQSATLTLELDGTESDRREYDCTTSRDGTAVRCDPI